MGPKNLHFNEFPGDADTASLGPTLGDLGTESTFKVEERGYCPTASCHRAPYWSEQEVQFRNKAPALRTPS